MMAFLAELKTTQNGLKSRNLNLLYLKYRSSCYCLPRKLLHVIFDFKKKTFICSKYLYHEKHGITIKTYFNIYWKNPWPLLAGENWKDVDSFNNLPTVSNTLSFEVFNKKLHMLCKNVYFFQITEPAITCRKILKSFSQREVTSEKER